MFKPFALVLVLLGFVFLTGCNQIQRDAAAIQFTSQLATTTALLTVDANDRPAAAREVYEIAVAINKASADQTDLSGVDAIAQQYLAQWNSPYKVVAGSLLTTSEQFIQMYLQDNYASASADDKVKALRAFISAASAGVEAGSLPYTQGVPTAIAGGSKPGVKHAKNVIVVNKFVWTQPKINVSPPAPSLPIPTTQPDKRLAIE